MQIASADDTNVPVTFHPLTHRGRDGKLYERDPHVDQQIAAALTIISPENWTTY